MDHSNCFVLKVALELDFGPSIVVEFACFEQLHFEEKLVDKPLFDPYFVSGMLVALRLMAKSHGQRG